MKSIITGIFNFFRLLLQPFVRILIRTQDLNDKLNVTIRRAVGKYFGTFVDFGDLTGYVMLFILVGIVGILLLIVKLLNF